MKEPIGIDFGTTNSLVACMDEGRPRVIPNARGSSATPSAVARAQSGAFLVGDAAKNHARLRPEAALLAPKRLLSAAESIVLDGFAFRPSELAAELLLSLKRDAERYMGTGVSRAVLTAPANFSDLERRALLEAGKLAGLEIVRILNEPTAAALARAWNSSLARQEQGNRDSPSLLLVYDFGGGTFDVTILRQTGKACTVLASRGEGRLGGLDLDRAIADAASRMFLEAYGLNIHAEPLLERMVLEQAERAKIELSERSEATIALPLVPVEGRLANPCFSLSRRDFESMALPYIEQTVALVERALKDAGLEAGSIDSLILSGGTSRIPLVRCLLEERFGLRAEGGVNPEEMVVLGAAVAGAIEAAGGAARIQVRDVVSRTYGLEIDGGGFIPIIHKNSPVPVVKSRAFTTVADGQDSVEIHVLQGESPEAKDNLSLGRFLLAGIAPRKAGEARINVDFSIDESDILHVTAKDLDSGDSQAIAIVDLDRGASEESGESLVDKAMALAERIEQLSQGLELPASMVSELKEACARARGLSPRSVIGDLKIAKAELEILVGELWARRASDRGEGRAGR